MTTTRPFPEQALSDLPVFPLVNVSLFPGTMLPLHIFEGRYRQMVRSAVDGHRCIAMARLLDPSRQRDDEAPIDPVAGLAVIAQAMELPDGRFHVLLHGAARVTLVELPFQAAACPFRKARATVIDAIDDAEATDLTAIDALARSFGAALAKLNPSVTVDIPPRDGDDEGFIDALSSAFVMDPEIRHGILGAEKLSKRADLLLSALMRQHANLFPAVAGGSN